MLIFPIFSSLRPLGGALLWKKGGQLWKKEETLELIREEKEPRMVPRYFQWVAVAPKMEKRVGGFMSQQGLILGVDSNCSGVREKRRGCVKELRNRIKPNFFGGYVLTVQRLLEEGEIVVPTFQTSGLAGLQGNENSRLLGTTGRRGQPISTAALLKTASNPAPEQTRDQQPIAAANTARVVVERHI